MTGRQLTRRAAPLRTKGRLGQFWSFVPLGRSARIVVAVLVTTFVLAEIIGAAVGATDESTEMTIVQVALTLSFLAFLWHPPAAGLVLQIGGLISVALAGGEASFMALGMGAGLVAATCSVRYATTYVAGFIGLLLYAEAVSPGPVAFGSIFAFVTILVISILIGSLLRAMTRRTDQLATDLAERERMLETAVQVERERIADELHDFIAHELTIIAMHARVLEQTTDPDVHSQSRDAIGSSARQALADIRRVLELTQATRIAEEESGTQPASVEIEHRRLLPTIADVQRELSAAGNTVELEGAYEVAPRMSRSMEMAMAQFLREAATNVVKHAAQSAPVSIHFVEGADDVIMRIRNDVNGKNGLTLPRGGYGIARMRERASVLGGAFTAGPTDNGWLLEVRLPTR